MDVSQLGQIVALVAVATVLARVVMGSVARAGEGLATLFVPPDRTFGWPHGVQEGDEPWGWRGPRRAERPTADDDRDDPGRDGGDDTRGGLGPEVRVGSLVVPVGRVAPVRPGWRPH